MVCNKLKLNLATVLLAVLRSTCNRLIYFQMKNKSCLDVISSSVGQTNTCLCYIKGATSGLQFLTHFQFRAWDAAHEGVSLRETEGSTEPAFSFQMIQIQVHRAQN